MKSTLFVVSNYKYVIKNEKVKEFVDLKIQNMYPLKIESSIVLLIPNRGLMSGKSQNKTRHRCWASKTWSNILLFLRVQNSSYYACMHTVIFKSISNLQVLVIFKFCFWMKFDKLD